MPGEERSVLVEQEIREGFLKIIEMMRHWRESRQNWRKTRKRIDGLEERMDRLEERMDRLEKDVSEIKEEQKIMNDRLDTIASMYGSHEEAIRRLKAKKIL